MRYFIVDAFTDVLFKGNQAGVCLLDEWLDNEVMQNIAAENNLAETAFVVKREDFYDLRWFTPETEIDLCGHATLASAFVISNFLDFNAGIMRFNTLSGMLNVLKSDDIYEMDFPSRKPEQIDIDSIMNQAVRMQVKEAYMSRDILLVFENEQQIRDIKPDFELLKKIPGFAVIVTAKGEDVDFVSRFFAPKAGILEDPVTGSSHCTLIPFWSEKFGKQKLVAKQLSKRGGTLYCKNCGERVFISGKARLYLQGEIFI